MIAAAEGPFMQFLDIDEAHRLIACKQGAATNYRLYKTGVHDMAHQINDVVPDFEADTTQRPHPITSPGSARCAGWSQVFADGRAAGLTPLGGGGELGRFCAARSLQRRHP